ncbi:MAG: MFS transporter, partial [Myxococcota bacterium]
SALSGVMTARSQDRTSLISIRFLFAFVGGALVNKFTLPLVEALGQGDAGLGWQRTLALYGAIACAVFIVTFAATRERIAPPEGTNSTPLADLKDLLANRPWLLLFDLAMTIMVTITVRGGSAYYYFSYYLERPDLLPDYLLCQMLAYAVGALLAPIMTRFMEKARLLTLLMSIVSLLSVLYYFLPKDMIWAAFALNILISLALGPKSPLTWSMYADTADFNEYTRGRRATAMTFAAATFAQKVGGSLGAAGMLWVLAAIGYAANEAQSGASVQGIIMLQTLIPGAFAFLAIWICRAYPLTDEQLDLIQGELQRHDH